MSDVEFEAWRKQRDREYNLYAVAVSIAGIAAMVAVTMPMWFALVQWLGGLF